MMENDMNQEYYAKFTDMAKRAQEPLQAWTELNVKTLQGLNYIKPEEFSSIKKPEELIEKQVELVVENGLKTLSYMQETLKILEKQVELAVANGHKALDYMQKSFQIFEKAMLSLVQETKANIQEVKTKMDGKH
jgi:S-adenosylhomocysteine hydrolase